MTARDYRLWCYRPRVRKAVGVGGYGAPLYVAPYTGFSLCMEPHCTAPPPRPLYGDPPVDRLTGRCENFTFHILRHAFRNKCNIKIIEFDVSVNKPYVSRQHPVYVRHMVLLTQASECVRGRACY